MRVNPPFRALFALVATAAFSIICYVQAVRLSTGQWWQAWFLITSSLWFLAAGGIQSFHKDGNGRKTPLMLLVVSILAEALKVYLLSCLPKTDIRLDDPTAGRLSIVAVVAGAAVAFAVFVLAALVSLSLDHAMVKLWSHLPVIPTVLGQLQSVVGWLQAHRVSAFSCVLASFLLASHFFALAVAFDDRAKSGQALYAAAPVLESDAPASGKVVGHSAEKDSSWTIVGDTVLTLHPTATKRTYDYGGSSTVKFFFEPGEADIQLALRAWHSVKQMCTRSENYRLDEDVLASYIETLPEPVPVPNRAVLARNLMALCTSRRWFTEIATMGGEQTVLIFGHANTDQFDARRVSGQRPDYRSNTELAAVRSHQAFLALNTLADEVEREMKKNVCARTRWEVAAGSSEDAMIDANSAVIGKAAGLDPQVSVEVKRELIGVQDEALVDLTWELKRDPSRTHKLDLLDYLYFMTYTISTTGYGDLMPIKPTTKFVTAVANVVEVIYLAMIFALIVMKREPEQRDRERSDGGSNDDDDTTRDAAQEANHHEDVQA